MSVEAKTLVQQVRRKAENVEFYTPTPGEQFSPDSSMDLESLRNNRPFNGLVKQLTIPYSENSPNKNKKAANHNTDRISFFANGDQPYSPFDVVTIPRDVANTLAPNKQEAQTEAKEVKHAIGNSFLKQAESVVALYCSDYFSPDSPDTDGFVSESQRRKFFNMREIAPEIVRIISDRDNYISKVQEGHSLNMIAAALHMVRHPETQMAIRVGIGGSDDKFTTARLPAYAIPALRIGEQINQLYEGRKVQKMKAVAFEKVIQEEERKAGRNLEKKEKQEIDKQIPVDETARYKEVLTDEEYENALKTYSISPNPVKIQFAFAQEAAIAINETKNPEEVRNRTSENIQVLDSYISTHFPNQHDNVEYVVDKPWDQQREHTKLQIEYLSTLLRSRRKEDPIIDETLSILERMGVGHGGEKGREDAAVYAAAHPLIFRDRVNLPFVNYFQSQDVVKGTNVTQSPSILFTIGGDPERHFCAIREFLAKEANPEDFKKFIQEKADATTDEQEKDYYIKTVRAVERWQQIVDTQRKNTDGTPNSTSKSRADLPIHVIPLITKIGEKPVYYATEADEAYGVGLNLHLARVRTKLVSLKTTRETLLSNPNKSAEEERRVHNEIILTAGIEYDLSVLIKEQHRNGVNKEGEIGKVVVFNKPSAHQLPQSL